MKKSLWLGLIALLAIPLMAKEPVGTVPRGSALEYPAHAKANGATMGARVLTPKQVHHAFSTDLNRCCLVVEVAIYPAKGKPVDVSLNNFALQMGSSYHAVKASSARLLAAELQQRNAAPAQQSQTDVTVYPEGHIGYGSSIDPITGRRVSGIDYGVGAGVGVGPHQPSIMRPASTPSDRRVMEMELNAKGLPQGETSTPVAGYIYFSLSKKDRKGVHHLKYTLNGKELSLKLK